MTLRSRLALWGLILLLVAAALLVSSAQHQRLRREAQEAERARLEAEGLLAAERASRARLEREAASLREQLARVRRAAPGARVREVTRWRTREVEVPCPPAPVPPPAGSSAPAMGSALRLQLRGLEARLETRAGQTVAVGEVEIWRTAPPPPLLLAREPLELRLHLAARPSPAPPRWLAGPAAGLVDGHWALGGAGVGPPMRVGRFEARPLVWGLAGGGDWSLGGAVVVGW